MNHPTPLLKTIPIPSHSWLTKLFRQTRTRILLLYLSFMLLCIGGAIPLFTKLVSRQVTLRVSQEMNTIDQEFLTLYETWQQTPGLTIADLAAFVDDFLMTQRPEDDIFLIFLIDQQLYRSNPAFLPQPMRPDSPLFQDWLTAEDTIVHEWPTTDPKIGNILYEIEPLIVSGEQRGVFVLAYITAGEEAEVQAMIPLFTKVTIGVVSIALLLTWLAMGKLLAPVHELADTARAISESDLSQRIDASGSGELADLTHTFNAMMDRLQLSFDSQRRFINDAGHELRTPITIVQGHLELMGHDPQEQQETILLVMDELDRMGRLVNDMIALAKAERPDFLQLETIEVSAFLQDLFSKAQALAQRNWQIVSDCPGTLISDRQRLTGALLNLLKNAAQHTQVTDTIELGCKQTATQIQFWVKDTGIGITLANQQRVFERFTRLAQTRAEGSGLGLAIVKAFVDAHRGRIELVSQFRVGSTFTMTLPRSPQERTVL